MNTWVDEWIDGYWFIITYLYYKQRRTENKKCQKIQSIPWGNLSNVFEMIIYHTSSWKITLILIVFLTKTFLGASAILNNPVMSMLSWTRWKYNTPIEYRFLDDNVFEWPIFEKGVIRTWNSGSIQTVISWSHDMVEFLLRTVKILEKFTIIHPVCGQTLTKFNNQKKINKNVITYVDDIINTYDQYIQQ